MDIDVTAIRSIVQNLKGYRNDIDDQATAIDTIRDNIYCYWSSESSQKYLDCMDETYKKLLKQKIALNSVITKLETLIDEVVEAERKLENIFSGGGNGGGSYGGR